MTAPAEARQPSVITFYSYKGGTGRTMALANAACLAARDSAGETTRVLVMDWDLEAPGLHKFFPVAEISGNRSRRGVIEYFSEMARALEDDASGLTKAIQQPGGYLALDDAVPLRHFLISEVVPGVDMIRAGALNAEYADLLGAFNWVRFYKRFPLSFGAFRSLLTSRYQFVFIDSRTGLTDVGGICTSIFPDKLIGVFTPNEQSLSGLLSVVRQAVTYRRSASDFRSLAVYPLPSRVEVHAEQELRKQWRSRYQAEFEKLFREIYSLAECNLGPYFDDVEIPHVPYYLFGERIAVNEPEKDVLSLKKAYERFFDQVTSWEAAWEQSEALQIADSGPLRPKPRDRPMMPLAPRKIEFPRLTSEKPTTISQVAQEFREGRIFPFLGQGVNILSRGRGATWSEGALGLPTGPELAQYLASSTKWLDEESRDLSRVAQLVSATQGPRSLYELLSKAWRQQTVSRPSPVHELVANVARYPYGDATGFRLIVTTTYDETLERAMDDVGVEYDVLSYVAEGDARGRFSHRPFRGEWRLIDHPNSYMNIGVNSRPVILRLFGHFELGSFDLPSIAITEQHMLDYGNGRNLRYLLPPPIVMKLQESFPLCLGCSIVNWPLRLAISRLPRARTGGVGGLAVTPRESEFEQRLWAEYGIQVIGEALDTFVQALSAEIGYLSEAGPAE